MNIVFVLVKEAKEREGDIVSSRYVKGIKSLGINFLQNIVGNAYLIGRIDENGDVLEYFTGKKIPCNSSSSNVRHVNAYDVMNIRDLADEQKENIACIVAGSTFTTDIDLNTSEEMKGGKRQK